jgi:uncharacterized protein (TIGR02118 family)
MIKFFGLIPRRPDISSDEFHDHYRHPHGTLGRQISTFRQYVQSHQIHTDLLGDGQEVFEAVAEVWFDTVPDAVGLADDPHYLEHVQPDEPNFVDMDKLKWLYTTEEVLISGPDVHSSDAAARGLQGFHLERATSIKLMQFREASGGAERSAEEDAVLGARLGAVRLVRCRPQLEIHAEEPPAFAEVQELWWPTVWAFEEAVGSGDALQEFMAIAPSSVTLLAQAERFI